MIYLDAAATSKYKDVDDIIIETMSKAMKTHWHNPSSSYASSVKNEIDMCRSKIAKFICARSDEICFTSGASESNNMAIRGWVDNAMNISEFVNVITTPIEHKSILNAVQNRSLGACVEYCDVDKYGLIDCERLEYLLLKHEYEHILVSVGMANNEIGTIQAIKKISELVHKYDGVLHVDATQVFGKVPIDVVECGIDMMSASGHKISPVLKGIGFLYIKKGIKIQPLIYGEQENGLRGGTENTYGIIGLNKAIEYCDFSYEVMKDMLDKRNYFITALKTNFNCKLNGHDEYRMLNNINVTFPQNITGESLLYMLDLSGIKISVGSACNSKSIEISHVLKAIGLTNEEAMKTIRITISSDTTYDEIDYTVNEIYKAITLIELDNGDY